MAEQTRLEELIALNGELAALARAGLPISTELTRAAHSMPGRTQQLSKRLAERVESGQSLSEAIGAETEQLPAYYAALVSAGEATGRLPSSLEAMSDALTRSLGTRRTVRLALVYPTLVAGLAFCVLVYALGAWGPQYDWVFEQRGEPSNPFRYAREITLRIATWAPIVLLIGLLIWLLRPNGYGPLSQPLGWASRMPGVGRALRLQASANYCRLLSLQLDHGTPLHEALILSAEATGWRPFVRPSKRLAEHLAAGGQLNDLPEERDALPALLAPALTAEAGADFTQRAVSAAAEEYDERAKLSHDTLSTFLPLLATTLIGGGAVALYAIAMFGPYVVSLYKMSTWL